jgi:hypothetical protein
MHVPCAVSIRCHSGAPHRSQRSFEIKISATKKPAHDAPARCAAVKRCAVLETVRCVESMAARFAFGVEGINGAFNTWTLARCD